MLRLCLSLALAGLFTACSSGSSNPSATTIPEAKSIAHQMANHTLLVSAGRLVSDFVRNEDQANANWQGKELLVDGVVEAAGEDMWNQPYLLLYTKDFVSRVQCFVPHADQLIKGLKNRHVNIKGYCEGFSRHVILRNASMITNPVVRN